MQMEALYMKGLCGQLDMIILMNGVLGYLDGYFKFSYYYYYYYYYYIYYYYG